MEVIDYVAFSALSYNNFPKGNNPDTNKPWTLSNLVKAGKIEGASFIEKENKIHVSKPELSALKGSSNPLHSYTLLDFISTPSGFRAAAFQSPSGEIVFSFKGTDFDLSSIKGYIEAGKDIANADAQIALGMSLNLPTQFTDAEKFVNSVLASHPKADYTFTGHSLGGSLAQYMTYKTGHKSTTFNGPGIGSLVESVTGEKINYSAYENLSTNYANESDLIGNLWNNSRIGNNKVIRSSLNNTSAEDVVAVSKMQALAMLMSTIGFVPSTAPKIMKEGSAALERLAKNATPTGNHGISDMMAKDGKLNDSTKKPDDFVLFMGYMTEGAKKAVEGGVFVFYVAGGLLTYGAEGVVKFVRTSKFVIEGLAYYGAEGVEKFIDTSNFVIAGLAYYIADGTIKFVDTTGNLIADGVWGGYSLLRGWFSNGLKGIQDLFNSATAAPPVRVDPLIFDLDGDGIKTTSLDQSRTYFDLDSNGFAERTAWVDARDGLLVLDRNNDGQITSGQELFGDQTLLANGVRAASGFEALREFDSNRDGRIDAKDEVYSKLKIWRDLNGDGISQAEELKGLSDYNIASISLSSTSSNASDAMNNIQRRVGSFIKTDGSGGVIGEYLLNRNTLESHDLLDGKITMSEDILALPDLPGAGNVSSLRVAMAKDTSGRLKKLVSGLVNADDTVNRNQLFTEAVYKLTGADTVDPKSRGNFIDARRLAVLEKFMGTDFAGSNGANPNENAAPLLNKAYRKLMNRLYASIAGNTFLKELVNKVEYTATVESGLVVDLSKVRAEIDEKLAVNPAAGRQMLDDFLRVAYGSGLEDSESLKDFCAHYATESSETAKIVYAVDRDAIIGSEKADSLYATAADTLLYGGVGNDTLSGSRGNDILIGGQGDDVLYGSTGDDIYVFSKGDGVDYISDGGGIDTIQFCKGIRPDDVSIKRVAQGDHYNLELAIKDSADRIVVDDYFGHYYYSGFSETPQKKIDRIVFADGMVWTQDTIYQRMHNITGTNDRDEIYAYDGGDVVYHGLAGNDMLHGGKGNDKLYGDDGDDTIYGMGGDDLLIGGKGTDQLHGREGNDTYIFSKGDGTDHIEETDGFDKIQFGEGILPEDVVLRVVCGSGNNLSLSITIKNTTDKIVVDGHFGMRTYNSDRPHISKPGNQIEQIAFSNGVSWDLSEIHRRAHNVVGAEGDDYLSSFDDGAYTYHGLSGNDNITGGVGGDSLYGDEGDDIIYGFGGNDTLSGGTGNDQLRGGAGDDVYLFSRGDGVDYIEETDGFDTIQFGENISPKDVVARVVSTEGNSISLELSIAGTNDKMTIHRHFGQYSYYQAGDIASPGNQIERVMFADGTAWDLDEIYRRAHDMVGTDGNDNFSMVGNAPVIYHGLYGNDNISGRSGKDILYGDAGDDSIFGGGTLIGGLGNDRIYGSNGDDVYIFNRGDGQDLITDTGGMDTIRFGDGIRPDDIVIKRVGNGYGHNLELCIKDTDDKVAVYEHFGTNSPWGSVDNPAVKIERVEFADGTVWAKEYIDDRMHNRTGTDGADTIEAYGKRGVVYHGLGGDDWLKGAAGDDKLYGDDGDDTISGGEGNNLLVGGRGNDIINGFNGDDTYIFNRGDGSDTIKDYGGTDTIQFGEGISPSDIVLKRVSAGNDYNLEISIKNTEDKVTVVDYFGIYNVYGRIEAAPKCMIEKIEFADGTIWTQQTIYEMMHNITGTDKDDTIRSCDDGSVEYHGLAGNDVLVGGRGNDKLYGDDGDDRLSGGEGNDLFVGGKGNDTIDSFRGDSTYVFNRGDGKDVVADYGGLDTLQFGEGIRPKDIILKRVYKNSDYNLEISIKDTDDVVTFVSHFGSSNYSGWYATPDRMLDRIKFADGTIWTKDDIDYKMHHLIGTEENDRLVAYDKTDVVYYGRGGNDTLFGSEGNDKLYGDDGDDTISGGEGNDLLVGGRGNDELSGYRGDDTYIFNKGDGSDMISECGGTDTIKFGEGITPDGVDVKRVYKSGSDCGYALELSLKGTSDKISVKNYFGYYSYSGFHKPSPESLIEKVVFADGTVWTQDTINSKVHNITGTEDSETIQAFDDDAVTYYGLGGNDNLYGSKSNDKLYGGTGNDRISGGEGDDLIVGGIGDDYLDGYYGNDAYIFNKGDGSDTVYDANGNDDKIILGYNSQDIMFERSGNNLRLRMIGSSDSVTINSWYTNNSNQYKIETFKSATGSTITHTQIENLIQAMSSFQKDTGMTWEQALTTQPSQVQAIVQEYWTVPGV